jgi:oxaloacetate decarboxylase alpha subunit
MINNTPLGITEVVLRDAHQSLLATRMRIDDMLPIAEKLDQVGYWSLETWGGATFDACIRYLGEDPWERLRRLKAAMPKTPQQMLLRGQNLLGYRHYADDVVDKFVERAAVNGIGVFRIFDAMNDLRNLEQAVRAALATDAHAQGTMSYTASPVHDMDYWWDMGRRLEDLGCHSICIKRPRNRIARRLGRQLGKGGYFWTASVRPRRSLKTRRRVLFALLEDRRLIALPFGRQKVKHNRAG